MQDIQTHARGAKFTPTTILLITHKAPAPVQDMISISSIQFFQTTTPTNCKCAQTALRFVSLSVSLSLSLSLFVSLFRVYNKHYILLSSCKALLVLLPATTLLLLVLLPATPLLLVLLPATSLVVVLFPATTLLLLLLLLPATTLLVLVLVLLPATTNPLLLVLQLLQSKRDSSK